jgi:uncharacterized membrane-anchored protein YhcB (DUF1043 family)
MQNIFKTKSMIYAALATVCSLLVILFTFLSTQAKEKESKDAEDKLKASVEEVSDTLSKSLSKTSEVIKNINSLGDSLNTVKSDLKSQVELLENSVDEAKRFQKLADEQNKRDKKRFELEAAKIVSHSNNIEFVPSKGDSSVYVFRHRFVNEGKRNGTLLSMKSLLLLTDDKLNVLKEILEYENQPNVLVTGRNEKTQGHYDYWSIEKFEKKYLETSSDNMVYIIKITYQDESSQTVIEETKTFRWWGFTSNGFSFSNLSSVSRASFLEYFKTKFE